MQRDPPDNKLLQFSLRSLFVVFTLLIVLAALPSFLPLLPAGIQIALVILVFLCALGGLALLPFVAILTFSILITPDERALKTTNLRRCFGLIIICFFAIGPLVSLGVHTAFSNVPQDNSISR